MRRQGCGHSRHRWYRARRGRRCRRTPHGLTRRQHDHCGNGNWPQQGRNFGRQSRITH
jgi:hypothetical protein